MLHTLHRSPFQSDMDTLLRMLSRDDELLLIADGVIAALKGSLWLENLQAANIRILALRDDIAARGLIGQISNDVTQVDYTDFVNLTLKHTNQMAW